MLIGGKFNTYGQVRILFLQVFHQHLYYILESILMVDFKEVIDSTMVTIVL